MLLAILALPLKVKTFVGSPEVVAVIQAPQSEITLANGAESRTAASWRFTNQGWTDMSRLDRPQRIKFERRIELVHPLVFTILVILVASGLLIWASEEWHWAQATGQQKDQ